MAMGMAIAARTWSAPLGGMCKSMVYFLTVVAAIAGFPFGYDDGVIAVALPPIDKDVPMSALVSGFMTAAVPLGTETHLMSGRPLVKL
jgi:hypothetical protein